MGWGRKFCAPRARLDISSLTTTVHPIGNWHAFAAPRLQSSFCSVGYIASLNMGVIAWSSPRLSDARATDPICHQSAEHVPSSRGRPLSVRTERTNIVVLEYAGLGARGFRSSRRLVISAYI